MDLTNYVVVCDETNNSQDDINQNMLHVDIFLPVLIKRDKMPRLSLSFTNAENEVVQALIPTDVQYIIEFEGQTIKFTDPSGNHKPYSITFGDYKEFEVAKAATLEAFNNTITG